MRGLRVHVGFEDIAFRFKNKNTWNSSDSSLELEREVGESN